MAEMIVTWVFVSVLFKTTVWNNVVEGKLSVTPKNVVASVGKRVEIRCSNNGTNRFIWDFLSVNNSSDFTISFGVAVLERFNSSYKILIARDGEQSLVIDTLNMNHAGRYRCSPSTGQRINDTSSEVTVLDTEPKCDISTGNSAGNVITEGMDVLFLCRISYWGYVSPTFKWSIGDDPIATVNNTVDNHSIPFQVISSIKRRLEADDDGVMFRCRIIFKLPNSAENVPYYEYLWNYTADVLYGPKNLTIHPNATTYKYGNELRCFASGNPTPTYQWADMNTGITVNGPILKISDSFEANEEYTFSCTAVNEVANKRRNASISLSFTITGPEETPSISAYLISAFAAVILLIAIAIVSFYMYVYRRNLKIPCLKRSSCGEPDVVQTSSNYDDANSMEFILRELNVPEGTSNYSQVSLPDNYSEIRLEVLDPRTRKAPEIRRQQTDPQQACYSEVRKKNKHGPGRGHNSDEDNPPDLPKRGYKQQGNEDVKYAELAKTRPNVKPDAVNKPSRFQLVDNYAYVDHTETPPPPLPPR